MQPLQIEDTANPAASQGPRTELASEGGCFRTMRCGGGDRLDVNHRMLIERPDGRLGTMHVVDIGSGVLRAFWST